MSSSQSDQPLGIRSRVDRIGLGIALVVLAAFLFALGGLAVKLLSDAVTTASALVWRNLLSAAILLPCLILPRTSVLKTQGIALHLARGLVTLAGLWAFFLSLNLIPLSTAVLFRTASPIFVPIAAFLLLRHSSDRYAWLGSWIGLVGVALVVEPSMQFSGLGAMVSVSSGFLGAIAAVLMWRLGRTESIATQTAWLMVVLGSSSVVIAPWCLTWPRPQDWPLIFIMAIATTASQVLLALAFKIAPADKIITWGYLSVAFGVIFEVVIWTALPSAVAILGICLVILGSHVASALSAKVN